MEKKLKNKKLLRTILNISLVFNQKLAMAL